ncbi:MAG: 4Fe-4S dicluster domain-containing protein [Oscillospiraceae bacterium]|nr:4Fe-4S dicluster domain-containing protein [Oscillospiraceae bacterium]
MHLNKKDLEKALSALAAEMEVFVPGTVDDVRRFVLWEGGAPDLGGANTELPPKDILFPETEKMYAYRLGENLSYSELGEAPKRVVFGIRPCDMQSIARMDSVFIKEGEEDSFYASRRANCVTVALSCPESGENCFCEAMGTDPNAAPGADVFLTDAGDSYMVTANGDKGKSVTELWKGLLTDGKEVKGNTHNTLKPNVPKDMPEKLLSIFEQDIWSKVSKPCLGCGTCTFVCPTCYCFDINIDSTGNEGVTFRCWDSCMFTDYNRIAGGINERPTKKERLRNRYMHKLSYYNQRYGAMLCVGCGRCITKCPAHLDIAEFINKAAEV